MVAPNTDADVVWRPPLWLRPMLCILTADAKGRASKFPRIWSHQLQGHLTALPKRKIWGILWRRLHLVYCRGGKTKETEMSSQDNNRAADESHAYENNYQQKDFDGKNPRDAVARRTVDYNSSAMRWVLDRAWQGDEGFDTPTIQPSLEATLDLVPPAAPLMNSNPISSACTKFVHSSVGRPGSPVHACKWTPEGKRLITGVSTGKFTLWEGLTFNFQAVVQAHDCKLRRIIWSHNGHWMLSGDEKGVVKYWLPNMQNMKAFQAHDDTIRDLSFSCTDNKFATCSDDNTVKVWDFIDSVEERVLEGHGWDVRCVDWHPTWPLLASGSKDSNIKIWDARTGKNLSTLHGHKKTVVKVKWNRNGNWLLSGSQDSLLKIYDIRMMAAFQTFRGHRREVTCLQWHPQHRDLFATGGYEGGLYFWLVGQGAAVASVSYAHQASIWDLDWHPMGHIISTSSHDHTLKFWTRPRPGDQITDEFSDTNGGGRWDGKKSMKYSGRKDRRRFSRN